MRLTVWCFLKHVLLPYKPLDMFVAEADPLSMDQNDQNGDFNEMWKETDRWFREAKTSCIDANEMRPYARIGP